MGGNFFPFINQEGPPESRKSVDGTTGGQNDTSTKTLDIGAEVIDI